VGQGHVVQSEGSAKMSDLFVHGIESWTMSVESTDRARSHLRIKASSIYIVALIIIW
jgi:hypothetical protein